MPRDNALVPATRRGIVPRLAGLVAGLGVLGLAARQPESARAQGKSPEGTLIRTDRAEQVQVQVLGNTIGNSVNEVLTCPAGSVRERVVMYSGGVAVAGPLAITRSWALDDASWKAELIRTGHGLVLAIAAVTCGYYRKERGGTWQSDRRSVADRSRLPRCVPYTCRH